MLVSVLFFGTLGGRFFGILGVTGGVTIGLVSASVLVAKLARELELESEPSGFNMHIPLLVPLVFAALTTAGFLLLAENGFSLSTLGLVTGTGLLGTMAAAVATTPWHLLWQDRVVNSEL